MGHPKVAVAILSLVLICSGCSAQGTFYRNRAVPLFVKRFETVFSVHAGLFRKAGPFGIMPSAQVGGLSFPFGALLGAVQQNESLRRANFLSNSSMTRVLVGAKNFRAPHGLGGVHADVCYLLMYSRAIGDLGVQATGVGRPEASAAGRPVWNWRVLFPEEGVSETFYLTQLQTDAVIVANTLEDLRNMTTDLLSASPNAEVPQVPDWAELSNSDLWGYRKYQFSRARREAEARLSGVTPNAQFATFLLARDGSRVIVRYKSLENTDPTAARISRLRATRVKQIGPATWEIEVLLGAGQDTMEGLFATAGLFGFGVFL
jgi:hypothetical protein